MKSNKAFMLVCRILIIVAMIGIATVGILYFIDMKNPEPSYFIKHFGLAIILFMTSIIAFVMPLVSNKNLSGENKGDKMMITVAVLLILCGLLSIFTSYIQQ